MAGNLYFNGQKVCPVISLNEPVISELDVTPTTSAQTITAPSGTDGYSPVNVSAVTASIDNNIMASNIKSGVSILGVNGSVVELNGSTKTINPSTSSQTVTPTSPSNGFTSVTVPAVTSSIDANIQAENIVDGVTILGVTGTAEEANTTQLSVTPTTSAQKLTPSSPYNGFDEVNVSAVTSSIDANITAGNIKSGVSILGVSGTVIPLIGETRSVSITSTSGNTFTPTSGKNGITSITVTPTNQAKTITPTTSSQSISVPSGYSGFGTLTVNAVTSAIDSDIKASNIKSGVSILGVSGSVIESNNTTLSVTPSTSAQSLSPSSPYNGYSSVSVSAVTSSIDNNITAENIKKDVTILGVTGTYEGSGGTKYGASINTFIGDTDANGVLQWMTGREDTALVFDDVVDIGQDALHNTFSYCPITSVSFPDLTQITGSYACNSAFDHCTRIKSISFPKLKTISGNTTCAKMFYNCYNTQFNSVSFPELETISGSSTCNQMFDSCSYLETASFPSLKTISANSGMAGMFSYTKLNSVSFPLLETIVGFVFNSAFYNTKLTSISFPELTTATGNSCFGSAFNSITTLSTVSFGKLNSITGSTVFINCFGGCRGLTSVSFPALTTTSFGSNVDQLNGMFNTYTAQTSGACTVHFPSNLQTKVSTLTGYPLFSGNSTRISLAFDLPATS